MVFHLWLSVSKFSQVFRFLLNILADLNYSILWMVSIHPLISNFSSPPSPLRILFQVRQLQLVSPSLSCSSALLIFWLGPSSFFVCSVFQSVDCDLLYVKFSFVCRLKYPYSCFSSHFYFLVIVVQLIFVLFVLFLATVINLSLFFFILSSSHRMNVSTVFSMVASLPPIYFLTHIVCVCHLWNVRHYEFSCSLVHFWKFFPRSLLEWSRVYNEEVSPGFFLSLLWGFCGIVCFQIDFSLSCDTLF